MTAGSRDGGPPYERLRGKAAGGRWVAKTVVGPRPNVRKCAGRWRSAMRPPGRDLSAAAKRARSVVKPAVEPCRGGGDWDPFGKNPRRPCHPARGARPRTGAVPLGLRLRCPLEGKPLGRLLGDQDAWRGFEVE